MAEAIKKTNLNAPESNGEKILRTGGAKGLIASDLPASEVVDTLTKRVREDKVRFESYGYLAPALFGRRMVFDGLLDVEYTELVAGDSSDPYSDVTIEDFNGDTNKAIRFTYEAVTQSNKKTKILNSVLFNFKTNPGSSIKAIFKGTENINKAQALFWAGQIWTVLADRSVAVDTSAATNDIEVNKIIYQTLIEFKKNSKAHIGVGTDPVTAPGVIADGKGNSVTPTYKFKSTDFYLLTTPEFTTNTVFDGERTFFNWAGSQIEVAARHDLFLDDEEMPAEVATAWAGVGAILVHKDAVSGIQDWVGTGVNNAGKLYQIFKHYMKQDAYPLYDAPVVTFNKAVTAA